MVLYAVTIFVSAFLLFLVQPIIAKQILPWFGGSAAVWTLCMVFFQLTLLAGYAYADWLSRARVRLQVGLHAALLAVGCASLPIVADAARKPVDSSDPTAQILWLLAATIGLPYFLVSTTGPLVQSWYARAYAGDPRQHSVFRLFAMSNLASLAALLAYPFAVEPFVTLKTQSWAWSIGFVLFAALAISTGIGTWRRTRIHEDNEPATHAADTREAPGPRDYVSWFVLAATGTVFLLGITAHVTQNVASVPFLWIVPLSIYLLTFILCFDARGWYRRRVFWPALLALLPVMAWGLVTNRGVLHFEVALPLYAAGLFVVCMFCHGELARAKPAPRWLTRFYLMISLGGAAGGLSVGIVAPRVFSGDWELPIAIVICGMIASVIARNTSRWVAWGALASTAVAIWYGVDYANFIRDDALMMARNFYGTLRVKQTGADDDPNTERRMMHGVILHGTQFRAGDRRDTPTSYYGETSGAGLAILLADADPKRVAVIGLGAGTLAAYGRSGDVYRYYEINPLVVGAARGFFTYLSDSKAQTDVTLGDARLVLEREFAERGTQRFDVMVIDAFSSDAIPVHLITREALAIYRRHLKPGGVIAFHVTNRYLNLVPVVAQLAADAGMHAAWVADRPSDGETWLSRTDYVLVTDNLGFLALDAVRQRTRAITPIAGLPLWTDDYNNLLRVLR